MSTSFQSRARGLERFLLLLKYYTVRKRKITFNLGAKIRIKSKKVSTEICLESRKKVPERICLSPPPRSETRWLERVIFLKYYSVRKWPITFNLGLNAVENTHHIQKSFKWKLSRIKFRTKMSVSEPCNFCRNFFLTGERCFRNLEKIYSVANFTSLPGWNLFTNRRNWAVENETILARFSHRLDTRWAVGGMVISNVLFWKYVVRGRVWGG